MTELTDALIEAVVDEWAKRHLGNVSPKVAEELKAFDRSRMTDAIEVWSRVLAERGLKVLGREATEGMTADLCLDWYAYQWWERMHDAAPDLLEPKP